MTTIASTQTQAIASQLDQRDRLVAVAADIARSYLANLSERPVAPEPGAVARLEELAMAVPEHPQDPLTVLTRLDEIGSPATMATAGPRFFGFVNGGAYPVAVAASWLCAAWDQNAALAVMAPGAVRLDEIALGWIIDLLGLPARTGGGFVAGATTANATCLAAARDRVLWGAGWDALADGLVGAPPVQVVVGSQAHPSVTKALGLVGLGRGRAVRLPVDGAGRIVPSGLPRLRGPAIVCLQAGNVNGGASDPFPELIEWAHEQGAWVHVDGAFGLWAAACPAVASQVEGVQQADSWATDAHKWLNTTYDCGIALVADPDALRATMEVSASYLPVTARREPAHYTPAMSQRARGVECWAVLAALGRSGVADLVEHSCHLARRLASGLRRIGFEVLGEVVLNQVVVAPRAGVDIAAVIERIQRDGTCWAGPATWRGRNAMRLSVSCWATTEADIDRSLRAIETAGTLTAP